MKTVFYFLASLFFITLSLLIIKGLEKPHYLMEDSGLSLSMIVQKAPHEFLGEDSLILSDTENTSGVIQYGRRAYIKIHIFPSQKEGYSQLIKSKKDRRGKISYEINGDLLSHYEIQAPDVAVRNYYNLEKGFTGYYVLDQGVLISVYSENYNNVSQLLESLSFLSRQENRLQKALSGIQSKTSPLFIYLAIILFLCVSTYYLFIALKSLTLVFRFKKGDKKPLDKEKFLQDLLALNESQHTLSISRSRKYDVIIDWNYLNETLFPEGERQDIKKVFRLILIPIQKNRSCYVYLLPTRIHFRLNRKRQIRFTFRFNFLGKRPLNKNIEASESLTFENPVLTSQQIKDSHFNPCLFLNDLQKKAVSEGWSWRPQLFLPLFKKKDNDFSLQDS